MGRDFGSLRKLPSLPAGSEFFGEPVTPTFRSRWLLWSRQLPRLLSRCCLWTASLSMTGAFMQMATDGAQALLVVAGSLTFAGGKRIADPALKHKLPSCHAFKEAVAAGGLVSLGPDLIAMNRQCATYVDKIMQGIKPADLPVERPTQYEMHVNPKTAGMLGLTIPPTLLARADEVIE